MKKILKGAAFALVLLLVAYIGGLFFICPGFLLLLSPYCGRLSQRINDYVVSLWLRLVPVSPPPHTHITTSFHIIMIRTIVTMN